MKKILFTNRYTHIDAILENLSESFDVTVLQKHNNDYPVLSNVKLINTKHITFCLPFIFNNVFKTQVTAPVFLINLKNILNDNKPDIIVVFDFYHFVFWQTLRYCRAYPDTKLILISETKSEPRNYFSRLFFWLFLARLKDSSKMLDSVMVFTEEGGNWFTNELPTLKQSLITIPVNTAVFRPIKNRVRLPGGKLRVIMNARYVPYKRHHDLLLAISRLVNEGHDISLVCIGRDHVGKSWIEEEVKNLKLTNFVKFLDPLPQLDLVNLYYNSDVLVLPSYNEAIGMVVPEAMACGLPTITSDTVGANVYVKKNVTGLIFKTGSIDDLALTLMKCFNPDLLSDMSEKGSLIIEKEFSLTPSTERFLEGLDNDV